MSADLPFEFLPRCGSISTRGERGVRTHFCFSSGKNFRFIQIGSLAQLVEQRTLNP